VASGQRLQAGALIGHHPDLDIDVVLTAT